MIDVSVNREIEGYQEQVFMGLDMRKAAGIILPVILCAICYVKLSPALGTKISSWICILLAAPIALMGFLEWHGMHFEQAAALLLRFLLQKKKLGWLSVNYNARYFAARITAMQRQREEPLKIPEEEGEPENA